MSDGSKIEWCDATWNPTRGCTKVSAGCKHCYAETFAERFRGVKGHPFEQGFDVRLVPEKLSEPLRWKRPRRVFVNSMSDLFHEGVPDEFIARVWWAMANTKRHTYQVLTKRPARMRNFLSGFYGGTGNVVAYRGEDGPISVSPPPHIWLGVSVENQETADERIPLLLRTPAAVRFVSVEPLLSYVDFTEIELPSDYNLSRTVPAYINALRCDDDDHFFNSHAALDWVVVGGESGPHARPCDIDWIRSIVRQCKGAGVPVFVKQLGSNPVVTEGAPARQYPGMCIDDCGGVHLHDRKGGNPSEWIEDLRVREMP